MLKDITVEVSPRPNTGKNESRRLRAEGQVPGIVYGGDRPAVSIAVAQRSILEILRSESGENTLFTLHLGGTDSKRVVMIRDFQRDPVKGRLLHVDFVRVDMSKEIEVRVPLHPTGTAIGVKSEGGLMDQVVREVLVSCLPTDIPASLDVDITDVHVGQHLSIKDVPLPERVRILADPDQTILVIALPRAEVAATAEAAAPAEGAAAAPAEPEVIKKGKEAAGEEAPAEPKKGGEGKKKEGGKS